MEFIETPNFTKWLKAHVTDEEFRVFQNELAENPEKGDLVSRTGGFRKARIAYGGQGKSRSGRVIYYWLNEDDQIYLVMGYAKNEQSSLSDSEKAILRKMVATLK